MQVRQAANVVELLEFFAGRGQPATMAEISDSLGWPRSSTFNLVGTLSELGYLYEPRGRGGYYPSPRWMAVVEQVARADPLPEDLLAALAAIRDRTGETACIASASGVHALMVHVCESRQALRYFAQAGSRVPIQASSVGRALLAQMTPAARQALYRRIDFAAAAPTAPPDAAAVEAELAAAARRGYHQSHSEYVPDLAGVALPLRAGHRRLSVVVAGPTSRCLDRRAETAALMRGALAGFLD